MNDESGQKDPGGLEEEKKFGGDNNVCDYHAVGDAGESLRAGERGEDHVAVQLGQDQYPALAAA